MFENAIKIFKLNYDGTFDEITYENIKNVFTIVNILAIYIQNKKIMYIWIGKSATQALKNHVARIREQIKEEFPEYRIIRNITFNMRSEPYEFFKNLEITKEELYQQIEYQEKEVLPILDEIKQVKKESEQLIENEEYEKTIELSKTIIKLAQKINDDAQIREYEDLILNLTEKYKMKKILEELDNEMKRVKNKYHVYVRTKDFMQAHYLIEKFVKKYEEMCDLSNIVSLQDLISEEKKMWTVEQDKLVKKLARLETDYILSLKRKEFTETKQILIQAKELLSKLINVKIKNRWKRFEEKLSKATSKDDLIDKVEDFLKESNELKKINQFGALNQKIDELLNQAIKEDIQKYIKVLNSLKKEITTSEENYKEIVSKINQFEIKIEKNKKNNLLEENIKISENIINLAHSINDAIMIKKYSKILENVKSEINERKKFEDNQKILKDKLIDLENELISSLVIMEIDNMKEILKRGEEFLSKLEDDDLKKKWEGLKNKYHTAKKLLEDVESLSNKGINALNRGICSQSLKFFEQIIYQLQEYKS